MHPSIHGRRRGGLYPRKHYYSYNNNNQKVMESVRLMSEAGIRVTNLCNVDEKNLDGIPRFLKDLKAGVAHKEKAGVYFDPLNNVRMGENNVPMWNKIKDAPSSD